MNQPNDGFSFSTGDDQPWSLDLDGAKDSPSHQDVHDVGRPEVSEVPSAPSILPLQVAKNPARPSAKTVIINLFRSPSL